MAIQVLDSTNLEAIIKDATGEGLAPAKNEGATDDKTAKVDDKAAVVEDPDDIEGEDGLTPREKRDLSAKMQKAVSKRTRMLREAEDFAAEQYRERRHAEQRAEQLERELQTTRATPKTESAVAEAPKKPDRKDFKTDDEFRSAELKFAVDEALAKRDADAAAAQAEARQAQVLADAKARIAKAIDLVPDFQEVTEAADARIPDHIAGYMQESEMFAELGYFLAKNQDVVTALAKLSPAKQLVEIGKIEGKLLPFASAKDAKGSTNGEEPKHDTDGKPPKAAPRAAGELADPSAARRAAPVITPISTNGAGSADMDLETGNVRDHIAEFARKRGANLLRRQRH